MTFTDFELYMEIILLLSSITGVVIVQLFILVSLVLKYMSEFNFKLERTNED